MAWKTNDDIIEEFRANEGKVGGVFENSTLLLLHSIGSKSGEPRVHPMMYRDVDGGYAVFASAGGSPKDPAWFRNIVANPNVKIEVGTETMDAVARVATGDERQRIWAAQTADYPTFARYEQESGRTIPVVVLTPAA